MFSRINAAICVISLVAPAICAGVSDSEVEAGLRAALQANPNDWQANYRLGEFYLHSGKIADGIPWMQRAVALQPGNYVVGYDLALAYYDVHDFDKARGRIEALRGLQDTAELHALLADVEEGAGNYLKAAAEYQKTVRLDPSEEHIFDWATELIVHQTYAASITILNRGVTLFPKSLRMNVGLGIALYLEQQYSAAMKQLCAATDLAPAEPWPYLILGASYAGMSSRLDTDEVRTRLKRFASLRPADPKALYYYGISLHDRSSASDKDTEEAEVLWKKAATLDPAFSDAHLQLGILYADTGNYSAAVEQLSTVVRLEPDLATAHYHLAQALMRTGQKLEGKRELEAFERLHSREEGDGERNRVTQFIVEMRDQSAR